MVASSSWPGLRTWGLNSFIRPRKCSVSYDGILVQRMNAKRPGPAGFCPDSEERAIQSSPTSPQVWAHLALKKDIQCYLQHLIFLSNGKIGFRLTVSRFYNSQGKETYTIVPISPRKKQTQSQGSLRESQVRHLPCLGAPSPPSLWLSVIACGPC